MTAAVPRTGRFDKSLQWLDDVARIVPAGCSTLAKTPWRVVPGTTPVCCVQAGGTSFLDLDGNSWLDFDMAMGTAVWGHARSEVEAAVIQQLRRGVSYSLPAPLELELANRLLTRFDRFQSVRFCKSGADAVTGAVRMARALTRRSVVIATGYHGWMDWSAAGYYGGDPGQLGIPRQVSEITRWVPGGREALEPVIAEVGDQCAAITLCPDTWAVDDLRAVVGACRRAGIVVVFDEVTSGIRMGRQATAGEVGVWPDLLCISKGLANGLPLAAVLGSQSLMQLATTVRFSNAHSSECLALAAAVACEDLMRAAPDWPSWRPHTTRMLDTIRAEIPRRGLADDIEVHGNYASFFLRSRGCADFWRDPFREHLVRRLAEHQVFSKGYLVFSDLHTPAQFTLVEQLIIDALAGWQGAEGRS